MQHCSPFGFERLTLCHSQEAQSIQPLTEVSFYCNTSFKGTTAVQTSHPFFFFFPSSLKVAPRLIRLVSVKAATDVSSQAVILTQKVFWVVWIFFFLLQGLFSIKKKKVSFQHEERFVRSQWLWPVFSSLSPCYVRFTVHIMHIQLLLMDLHFQINQFRWWFFFKLKSFSNYIFFYLKWSFNKD